MAETPRAAFMMISREFLHRMLLLPDDVSIGATHYDPVFDQLVLRIDGPSMPIVDPHSPLHRLNPQYELHNDGRVTLDSLGWPHG